MTDFAAITLVRLRGGRSQGQALINEFLHHLLGQIGAGLELVDSDAFDSEFKVVGGLDFLHFFQQGAESAARKIVEVNQNQGALGLDQRAAGVEVQRWGSVDVNLAGVFGQQFQGVRSL